MLKKLFSQIAVVPCPRCVTQMRNKTFGKLVGHLPNFHHHVPLDFQHDGGNSAVFWHN